MGRAHTGLPGAAAMTASREMAIEPPEAGAPSHRPPPSGGLIGALFPPIFALLYAGYLTALPLDVFLDRDNYIVYALVSELILIRYEIYGWTTVLVNEPAWLLMNIALSRILPPEDVLRVFIFVPAFLTAFLVLRRNPRHALWLVLFLIMPLVVKNYIIHLRQGAAIALFLAGYFSNWRRLGLAAMVASAFVHSSFFFVLAILLIVHISGKLRISDEVRIALFVLAFVLLGLALGSISTSLGARQAEEYGGLDFQVTGFSFVFWSMVFMIFVSAGREFIARNTFPIALLAFYLATYFLIVFSGRIFESSVIVILLAGLSLDAARRNFFLGLILLFTVANYIARLGQPWLGWGAL